MGPLFTPRTVIAGDVVLRSFRSSDASTVLAAVSDPAIAVWAPQSGILAGHEASARAWCAERADWSDGTHASWAVTLGGQVAGEVALFKINYDQLTAEVGYFVLPQWRRQNVASRALGAAAQFAFASLGLVRVELFHAVENVASCGVAERGGFRLEGTHRQSYRYGDGNYHDEHSHARLASDFTPRHVAPAS